MTHIHTFPVDPSLTPDEAWEELCLMGVRATNTGPCSWANIRCDGQECHRIATGALHSRPVDDAEGAFVGVWKASYSDRELLLLMRTVDHSMLP